MLQLCLSCDANTSHLESVQESVQESVSFEVLVGLLTERSGALDAAMLALKRLELQDISLTPIPSATSEAGAMDQATAALAARRAAVNASTAAFSLSARRGQRFAGSLHVGRVVIGEMGGGNRTETLAL